MQDMVKLIDNYDQREEDECWWKDEYGNDLTEMIDCHVVFEGDPPCLLDERKIEWEPKAAKDRIAKQDACAECKAIWLMEKYE